MSTFLLEEMLGRTVGSSRPVRLLGHGKLSAVYEAQQPEQNRTAMLTVFLVPETLPQDARERFLIRFNQEANALTQMNHPALLPVYDFGDFRGYPYLVTPFVNKVPLARLLKQGHLSPQETLSIVQQIASCLDYAHHMNVIHGTLSSTNILIDQNRTIQIAGFGFMRMLEARGILPLQQPYGHLLSIADTFLSAPEYLSPEYVQGQAADGRIDVYALGVLLYEMLSGESPFRGTNPYEVALQHVQNRVPSLHEQYPFVPAAFDVVIDQALERNPMQRFQTAGALAIVFERVLQILASSGVVVSEGQPVASALPLAPVVAQKAAGPAQSAFFDSKSTMPPTVNWFDQEMLRSGLPAGLQNPSQGKTGPVPAVTNADYRDVGGQRPLPGDQAAAVDPFAWWSAASQPEGEAGRFSGEGAQPLMKRPVSTGRAGKRGKTVSQQGRRKTIAVLATSGVVALGVLGFGGISLAHLLQKQSPAGGAQANLVATPTHAPTPTTPPTPTPHATPTQQAKPSPTPTKGAVTSTTAPPTATPAPTPTVAPTPTPGHTGTVVGSTSQGTNSSKTFTNPADSQNSLLIHLANGNFVAYETACPHEGVTCYYDSAQQKIVCPRHNALFDPAAGARVLQGPPPRPLNKVAITVNGDGTITAV